MNGLPGFNLNSSNVGIRNLEKKIRSQIEQMALMGWCQVGSSVMIVNFPCKPHGIGLFAMIVPIRSLLWGLPVVAIDLV